MAAVGRNSEGVLIRIRYWIDNHRSLSAGIFAGVFVILLFVYLYSLTLTGEFRLDFVTSKIPRFIFVGMITTLMLTGVSYVLGMSLGFLTAYARISDIRALKALAKGYIDAFRGTPILVQILLWMIVVAALTPGYRAQAFVAAIAALTINTGAYQAEIFRGGFKAIQEGQIEAGRALGFTSWQLMKHIKLPQVLRLVTPPMTNEFIALLKASALLSIIGVVELTFIAKDEMLRTFLTLEPWTLATLLYLAMTVPLAKLVQFLEIKFRIPGLGLPSDTGLYRGRKPRPGVAASQTTMAAQSLLLRRDPLYEYFRRRNRSKV
ncbi:MAG: amino acid ABC transporter permease [Candidatus Thermoplasmatota archaeon]|nr:amino acid ABC transporter permease [Candidatus Thermoplasmatota archaeon]